MKHGQLTVLRKIIAVYRENRAQKTYLLYGQKEEFFDVNACDNIVTTVL
jgi:uncharacterized protein YcgL (UPF0745 family)